MKIIVLGAGMMARAVVHDLVRAKDVAGITVVDHERTRLRELAQAEKGRTVRSVVQDLRDRDAVRRLMEPCDVAISCVPYFLNLELTKSAVATRTHFCDLGGNNDVVRRQLALDRPARAAGVTIVPDCGLAPGLVSILAADGVARLDRADEIHLRVGGLPRHPKPPLNYGIVFSANGLINEYAEPTLVLRNGRIEQVAPLAEIEPLRFPPPFGALEAFTTSGGISTLPQSFRGKVKSIDYKTIRYPGHCAKVRVLYELGLTSAQPVSIDGVRIAPRRVLTRCLEETLGFETDDVVLLRVQVKGRRNGKARTITYQSIDYADRETGLTAMMRMTGFPAAVVALMLGRGQASRTGAVPGEKAIPPAAFISELGARGIAISVRT